MKFRAILGGAALVSLCIGGATVAVAQTIKATDYKEIARYEVGGDGFWDYLTCDSAGKRLFITRGSHVMVVSAETGKIIGDIPDLKGCHGVALVPEMKRGFISNGGDNTVTIFDMATLKTLAKVPTGQRPDAIMYDPATKRIFTFNAGSQDTTALDAATGKIVGSVPLGGKPEFAQSDGNGHVFVNVEDKNELVTFDSKALKVLTRTALAPAEEPSGLALDKKNNRLFACCGNKCAAVVDSKTGKLIATPAIGDGPDAASFDPGTGLTFISNGEGTISVLSPSGPSSYTVETLKTERGARTMTLDPATHRLYTVTAKFTPPAAGQGRPGMVPGSFVLLVYGTK